MFKVLLLISFNITLIMLSENLPISEQDKDKKKFDYFDYTIYS